MCSAAVFVADVKSSTYCDPKGRNFKSYFNKNDWNY